MSTSANSPRRVAIIGGGITGLAAAQRAHELDPTVQVTIYERSDRLGGVLFSERELGYLLEHSADNFITNIPWGLDLCRRIGFEPELIGTRPTGRRALVLFRGRTVPVPEAFVLLQPKKLWPVVTTPLLSWRGKLRLLAEWFVPARADRGDESLASFVTRRLGREAFERLVQPLVGGIYTADASQLSLAATMPQFLEMEHKHGGLLRAAWRQRRETSAAESQSHGARYSLFTAPRNGMSSLVDALAATLPPGSVRLQTTVERVTREPDGRWRVQLGAAEYEVFDAVVVASPAPSAARLTADIDAQLSQALSMIAYAGAAIALVGCRRDQLTHPLDGFGFVVPEIERRRILSVSFSSQKYEGRATDDRVLLRVFVGGATHPELLKLDDHELRALVLAELRALMGLSGEPELFKLRRWEGVMPQYHLGHLERVADIERRVAQFPGLALAGNAFRGVGIPQCIRSGQQAAEKIIRELPTHRKE